jgi:ABC-type uncharacterized transport system permease subunit
MMIFAITFLTIILYVVTAVLLARRLVGGAIALDGSKLPYLALGLGAVILHAGGLYQDIVSSEGVNLGFYNTFSLTTWLIALLVLLAAFRQPIENLAIAVLPLAAIALLMEHLFAADHLLGKRLTGEIQVHIILSVLAYSMLGIAALQAVVIAIQDRQLRHKHPGGFMRALPPLQVMETLLFQIIAIGFILLTLSLLSGILYLEDIFAQHLVHKTVLSIIAWLVFGILLWGRWQAGWRGRTAIRWTFAGFFLLLLAYFGSKLVLELILGR